jgi:hypothetical protein
LLKQNAWDINLLLRGSETQTKAILIIGAPHNIGSNYTPQLTGHAESVAGG